MHFPKYWGKGVWTGPGADGRETHREVWRSSDESVAHAEELARAAAENLGRTLVRDRGAEYPYADRVLREPVLREVATGDAACAAVITRTAYGSEVLNAASVMFVDIDFPRHWNATGGLFARLKRLFGGVPPEPAADPDCDAHLATLTRWQAANPEWSFRVYRTHGGLRYLATNALHDPVSERTHTTLAALGCDPRYKQLCQVQKSFRARLTPKPWRCGHDNPPAHFPCESYRDSMARWIEGYTRAAVGSAVCRFLQSVGRHTTHPAVGRVIAEHDTRTKADSNLPLA